MPSTSVPAVLANNATTTTNLTTTNNTNTLEALGASARSVVLGGDKATDEAIRTKKPGSKRYQRYKDLEFQKFVDFVSSTNDLVHFAKLVPDNRGPSLPHIPLFIASAQMVDPKTPSLLDLYNTIFICWFDTLRGKKEGTPMQPTSFGTKLRRVITKLSDYGVLIKQKHLKGTGSLDAHTSDYWARVAVQDTTFGARPNRVQLEEPVVRSLLDWIRHCNQLDDYAREVVVVSNGLQNHFGACDHYDLEWTMIEFGTYGDGHEYAGQAWVEVGKGLLTKKRRITMCECCFCRVLYMFLSSVLSYKTLFSESECAIGSPNASTPRCYRRSSQHWSRPLSLASPHAIGSQIRAHVQSRQERTYGIHFQWHASVSLLRDTPYGQERHWRLHADHCQERGDCQLERYYQSYTPSVWYYQTGK